MNRKKRRHLLASSWVAPELAQAGKLFRLIVYRKHGWRITRSIATILGIIPKPKGMAVTGKWRIND